MLRTNLSSRPFYNERAVRIGLGAVAALAVGLTLFNAIETLELQGQSSESRQLVAQNEVQAHDLRDKAAAIRRSIDRSKLDRVQVAAREANALIDRRTFSWTELLNQFQSTLPADVRIAGVVPQTDPDGRHQVQITVFERRIEDLEAFMDALEKTGAFSSVLSRSDHPNEDGTIQSDIQAYYKPSDARAASQPAQTSEPGRTAGNATPNATPAKPTPAGPR
jgi:Tfp pilus assembly protein PilN